METLTNIYLFSVSETIEKLEQLSLIPIQYQFKSQKALSFDDTDVKTSTDAMRQAQIKIESQGAKTNRMIANEYPFFEVTGKFVERPIPEHLKYTVYVDQ